MPHRQPNLPRCLELICFALGIWLFLTIDAVAGDPPKIDFIFPSGGQRGTTVECKLSGKPGTGPLKVWSELQQLKFQFGEKRDTATVEIPSDADPGIHWLRFHNEFGATSLIPFFVGLIAEVQEAEPNNQPSDATPIGDSPTTVNGVLEKSNEVDIYSVSLKSGDTLVAAMEANRQLGSPMDAVLQILDGVGTVVAHNDDDQGFDPLVAFTAEEAGQYFVRTFAFPATPNSTIRLAGAKNYIYRLTLTTGPFIHHTSPLSVQRGETQSVALGGWNLEESSEGVTPKVQTLVIGALPLTVPATEHKTASMVTVDGHVLELPVSVTGRIATGDKTNSIRFHGKKAQSIDVSVAARRFGSLLDPVVTISSADGKVVKETDDASREDLDAKATVKLRVDGEHTATVSDRYQSGGPRHFYELTLVETSPDFNLAVKQSEFVLTKEKPLEIAVDIERLNGFAASITIECNGLPKGITAEPAMSEAKGDTAKKATLKISRSVDASWSGPIRIKGVAGEKSRLATSKSATTSHSFSELWLTAPPPE